MRRRLIVAAAVLIVVAGATVTYMAVTGGNAGDQATNTPSGVGDLIAATHPECASEGQVIARYLSTGDTSDDPEVDQAYAERRAEILQQPKDARAGLIRATADDYISQCDQQKTQAEQRAAAEAQRQAQEQAQQQAQQQQAAQQRATFAATCQQHHGNVSGDGTQCTVSYPNGPYESLPINSDGTWDQAQADSNRQFCQGMATSAADQARAGYPWKRPPQYHADTGICDTGASG